MKVKKQLQCGAKDKVDIFTITGSIPVLKKFEDFDNSWKTTTKTTTTATPEFISPSNCESKICLSVKDPISLDNGQVALQQHKTKEDPENEENDAETREQQQG
ncbi:uncharacterized protein LOC106870508 [Octopus bimaculoides]|uniref:uncharacterized protein LOC106870508 n=1 Tax=Octopus bimaculoides TaxID=37653 RepID=UPI00071CB678|nr:uncharacterized protein LOC106870508 [Octopus bimaculoides]